MTLTRTTRRLGMLALAMLWMGCPRLTARSDDALEPNDDFAHASPLAAGQTVKGRANQGNLDVFVLQAPAGKRILFRLESLGLENCPAFTAMGPGDQVLYRDAPYRCSRGRNSQPAESVEGAALATTQTGYELRVPAGTAGTYFLTINEQGEADNMLPLSWDYQLTFELE